MSSEERSRLVSSSVTLCKRKTGINNPIQQKPSSSSEEWEDDSSSSSYSSDSSYSRTNSDDSYFANWEEHVDKDGSLFYVEFSRTHNYHTAAAAAAASANTTTTTTSSAAILDNAYNVMQRDFKKSSTRRSSDKKQSSLMKFLTKDDADQSTNLQPPIQQQYHRDTNKNLAPNESLQFASEIHEIELLINPDNRFKFGHKATITESLLGISTTPSIDDPNKLVLAEHMMHSTIIHEKSIKIGDILVSVNNVDVTVQNINDLLGKFLEPTKICLKFQRILTQDQVSSSIIESEKQMRQLTKFDEFIKEADDLLRNPQQYQQQQLQAIEDMIFSLIILNEEISGTSGESSSSSPSSSSSSNDVIFCYPPAEQNVLYNIRGTFLTLNSILKSEFKTEPLSTTVKVQDTQYNVCYMSLNKVLILYAISENYSSLKETRLRLLEFLQYVQFYYLTIESDLDEHLKIDLERICKICKIHLKNTHGLINFEQLLQGSKLLPLPKEAQLRIFDALSEMEAMDYRDWNDEPLISHREFFIYGSALYFRSYLLVSQLPTTQLQGLEAFLRCRGIFDLIEYQNVRDLVIWIEIPLPSHSRHFLAISSRNQLLLAVILQAFDPCEKRINLDDSFSMQEKIIPPSLFYIEEIQETLDHLRHGGIETLAKAWIYSNKRPQIVQFNDVIKNMRTTTPTCSSGLLHSKKLGIPDGSVSVTKRCSLSSEDIQLCSSLGGSSAQSLSHSEDSNQKLNDYDSDSDWEGFPDSHKSSSGFDMSEMTESLLKEVSDIVPSKITAGKENVLLNYIHLDIGTGMILTPPDVCLSSLTNKFRKACHVIHTVLQNTKKFRRLLSQESTKPTAHKNLVAIKEHGILISDNNDSKENTFWVVGRLFASPPRELYICHRSDIPQNLVEIAFRLSFYTAG